MTLAKQITLLEGDAVDTLSTLDGEFDFVFMDSAKSKYIVFLPEVLKHLKSAESLSLMMFSKAGILSSQSKKCAADNGQSIVGFNDCLMRHWIIQI